MKINDKIISPAYHTYPFKMYINTLLSHGFDSKHTKLQALGFSKDTAGQYDKLITVGLDTKLASDNKGLYHRRKFFSNSGQIELYIPLGVDLAQQPNLLLSKLKMEISVLLNSKEFVIMADEGTDFDFVITEARLFIKKVELQEETNTAIENVLADYPARYFYNQRIVRLLTLTSGQANFWFDPLVTGKLPLRAIVGINTTEAVNGKFNKNPYNFQPHSIKELCFVLNGKKFPSYEIKPDFDGNQYIQYFMALHNFAGSDINTPYALDITKDDFVNGSTLFCISFTPEIIHDFLLQPREEEGPMRIDISFKNNLTTNLTLVLWLEYPHKYVITSSATG
jgi:hypothetical protein